MIDEDIRRSLLVDENRMIIIAALNDGRWQVSVKRKTPGNAFGVFIDADPIEALRMACEPDLPVPPSAPKPLPGLPMLPGLAR